MLVWLTLSRQVTILTIQFTKRSQEWAREAGNIFNPLFDEEGEPSTDFSIAANVVDFGIRAYVLEKKAKGAGYLKQIFPDINNTTDDFLYRATSRPGITGETTSKTLNQFPDVVDVMIRVLTAEGASALNAFENGLIPLQEHVWTMRLGGI